LGKLLDDSQVDRIISKKNIVIGMAIILVKKDVITPQDIAEVFPQLG
jgi:hypothetical protein